MESKFTINNFDSFSEDTQKEIQDYISGITVNWTVEFFSHCDSCSLKKDLIRKETNGGIIRVCKDCIQKIEIVFKKSSITIQDGEEDLGIGNIKP